MDFISTLQERWNIDLYIFLIVMLSGFFQERYLKAWYLSKDKTYDGALKTLLVSFIVSSIYILLAYKEAKQLAGGEKVFLPWIKYLITYFTATSIYELLVKPFVKWIKKITGNDETIKP